VGGREIRTVDHEIQHLRWIWGKITIYILQFYVDSHSQKALLDFCAHIEFQLCFKHNDIQKGEGSDGVIPGVWGTWLELHG
jgi:hypothetical protein